jgi:hypothetical protein
MDQKYYSVKTKFLNLYSFKVFQKGATFKHTHFKKDCRFVCFVTKDKFLFLFRDFRLNQRKINIVESRLLLLLRKMNENETKV